MIQVVAWLLVYPDIFFGVVERRSLQDTRDVLISGDPEKITCIEERLFQQGGWWAKFLRPEILRFFFHQFFSMYFLRVEKIWRCLVCFFF